MITGREAIYICVLKTAAPLKQGIIWDREVGISDGGVSTSGGGTEFNDTGEIFNINEWYEFIFTHQSNGSMSLEVNRESGSNVVSWSTTDTTFTSGGIGFSKGGTPAADEIMIFDDIEIEDI